MPDQAQDGSEPLPAPELHELFAAFLGIGVMGFGGVLPWARRMAVEQRRWLTGPEFTDLLALCQFLPGPNIVNFAVALGSRFRGVPGALMALAGLLAAPTVIVIGLGGLYDEFGQEPVVRRAFEGLAGAASGLVVAMACRIAWPIRASWRSVAVACAAFAAIAVLRLPLLPTMLVLAPCSILLLRRSAR